MDGIFTHDSICAQRMQKDVYLADSTCDTVGNDYGGNTCILSVTLFVSDFPAVAVYDSRVLFG